MKKITFLIMFLSVPLWAMDKSPSCPEFDRLYRERNKLDESRESLDMLIERVTDDLKKHRSMSILENMKQSRHGVSGEEEVKQLANDYSHLKKRRERMSKRIDSLNASIDSLTALEEAIESTDLDGAGLAPEKKRRKK